MKAEPMIINAGVYKRLPWIDEMMNIP